MKKNSLFIIISSITCILACVLDFSFIFLGGAIYPGYNQLKNTISMLGATLSPVANEMSVWWVFLGIILMVFGMAFRKAFSENPKPAKLGSWIIILYGIGEGIGSGAFKANHIATGFTPSLIIHDTLGGLAVFAILLLPLVMRKIIPKSINPWFSKLSIITFIGGIITVFLFMFRYLPNENNFFTIYKGLWQRMLSLNIYIYLVSIAWIIIRKEHSRS